jgi:hypothetical protein
VWSMSLAHRTQWLIDRGAPVNARNKNGETALHKAIFNNAGDEQVRVQGVHVGNNLVDGDRRPPCSAPLSSIYCWRITLIRTCAH